MANGDHDLESMPWKKAVWVYMFRYGFQGLVALILLGAFLGLFDNPIKDTLELMKIQATALAAHQESAELMRKELARSLAKQNNILVQICVQSAPTASDRLRCVGVSH